MGLRVLVVEDDASLRDLTAKRLELLGHSVTLAENGAQAVDLCVKQGQRFDVILMDMHMPVMDGTTAISHLRANPSSRDTPILCASAGGCAEGMRAGADHFLTKPYKLKDLEQAIEHARTMRVAVIDLSENGDE